MANDQPEQDACDQTHRLLSERLSLPNDEQPRRRFPTVASGSALAGLLGAYGTLAISQFIDSVKKDPEHHKLLKKYFYSLIK